MKKKRFMGDSPTTPAEMIQKSADDIEQAMGLYETAVNRLSGTIPQPIYDPMYKELLAVQGKNPDGSNATDTGWAGTVKQLDEYVTELENNPPSTN